MTLVTFPAFPCSLATGHAAYATCGRPVTVHLGLAARRAVCHDGPNGPRPTRAVTDPRSPVTVIPQPAPTTRSGAWPSMLTVRSPPHRYPPAWSGMTDLAW